jgi:rhamnosyltransferase
MINTTIIVLYKPEVEVVETIKNFASKKNVVIVVVNEASIEIIKALNGLLNVVILTNKQNVGLAIALNQGLKKAFEMNAEYTLFLDQDSKPYFGMELDLINEIHGCINSMICPTLIDIKQKKQKIINESKCPSEVIGMATSGTFLKTETALKIGFLKDELFIDGIDHEWCFRAHSLGVRLLQSNRVCMLHNMGDRGINFFGKHKPIHDNPIRHYYIVRNFFYLLYLDYVPIRWKLVELLKTVRRIPVYVLTSKDKNLTTKFIIKGIADGISRKWGKRV